MKKIEELERKGVNNESELGLVLTPEKTAEYIVSKLSPFKDNEKILDPCAGPGVFIDALLKAGVDKKQIFCYDINPIYRKKYEEMGIQMQIKDYLLSYSPLLANQFDVILGNPPYLNKASTYVRANRKELKKIYAKINAHETYAMFIVSSIWRLRNGGRLGFITSDSFLTLKTHEKLRKFLLKHCEIKEILLAPENLFDKQNVNTNSVILVLEKCVGKENKDKRFENVMRVIPRVKKEQDYWNPPKINYIFQKKYHLLPFCIFFTEVEEEIIDFFESSSKLEDFLQGYIGMHTHDNLKYIAAIEGTELAEIFRKKNEKKKNPKKVYKIISKDLLESENWKPYLKRGGGDQYYRPIMEAVEWNSDALSIYDIPKNVPFEKEGIVISGVSSKLAARYMPEGCFWDSNKAIGFTVKDNSISIEFFLGILNSSLYNYLMNGIINNTNSIQLTGIHSLPFIKPDKNTRLKIECLVREIIAALKNDLSHDYTHQQQQIDDIIFRFYQEKCNFKNTLKEKIDKSYSNYSK